MASTTTVTRRQPKFKKQLKTRNTKSGAVNKSKKLIKVRNSKKATPPKYGKKKKKATTYNSDEDSSSSTNSAKKRKKILNNKLKKDIPKEDDNTKLPMEDEDDHYSADAESDNDENKSQTTGNEGWADVMSKILRQNIPQQKQSAILAKSITDKEIMEKKQKKQAQEFEIQPLSHPNDKSKTEVGGQHKKKSNKILNKTCERTSHIEKEEWNEVRRVKPSVLTKAKEIGLQRIATKGIVQLFNTVKARQKDIEEKIKKVGKSEVKREKILKSMTKGEFLDVLKSKAKSIPLEEAVSNAKTSVKNDGGEEIKPAWKIFRDDYMMGATMKDWDKESDSDSDLENRRTISKVDSD